MARPRGSKNKTQDEKIQDIVEEVKELKVNSVEKQEAIDEIEDLLGRDVEVVVTEEVAAQIKPKEKELVGYHPITGKEIWE